MANNKPPLEQPGPQRRAESQERDPTRAQYTHRDPTVVTVNERIRSSAEQDGELVYVSEGSFGRITAWKNGGICFKTIMGEDETGKRTLLKEFHLALEVSDFLDHLSENEHRFEPLIPLRFWDTGTGQQLVTSPDLPYLVHPATNDGPYRSQTLHPSLTASTFSMRLAPPLRDGIVRIYKELFFGPDIINVKGDDAPIRLLRLYFGRTFPPTTESLAESLRSDLPLDIPRYNRLRAACPEGASWPTVEEISEEMGAVLAVLHWGAGIDASDIELVLGGMASNGIQPYVLDYNQCTRWAGHHPVRLSSWLFTPPDDSEDNTEVDTSTHGAHLGTGRYLGESLERIGQRLATKLHYAEYYYPRPSISNAAYLAFRGGYIDRVGQLLDHHAAPDTTRVRAVEAARTARSSVMLGATAFVDAFERLDREQYARREARTSLIPRSKVL